uniref:POU domain protein n=1 Tax=Steinernema glaseri TaxID=37863 RepID=A0A1I7ZNW7_9BILA
MNLASNMQQQRIYPGLNPMQQNGANNSSGRYSPNSLYKSRMQPTTSPYILCCRWSGAEVSDLLRAAGSRLPGGRKFCAPPCAELFNSRKCVAVLLLRVERSGWTAASRALAMICEANTIFGPFDDTLFQARAQAALAEMDAKNANVTAAGMLRPSDMFSSYHATQNLASSTASTSDFDPASAGMLTNSDHASVATSDCMTASLDSMTSLQQVMAMQHHYPTAAAQFPPQYPGMPPFVGAAVVSAGQGVATGSAMPRYPLSTPTSEIDTDPRELERFAEHFKQRRIKLGVTQADVGKALAHLKMPGVGSLSQSTICRFESLTLSHNNMVALKPILHSWLDKAEEAMKTKDSNGDANGILPNSDKKRKRTSIAAPEKRLLEDYFRQQPRPSGERISAIADKLDLKKNVVRVWFCNQRQKQKRSHFRCRNQVNAANGSSMSSAHRMIPQNPVKCPPFGDISLDGSQDQKTVPNLGFFC